MTADTDQAPAALGRRKLLVGLAAGAAAAVLGTVGVIAFTGDQDSPAGTSAEPTALALPGLDDDGTTIALSSYRGKPVIVNLFASWCDVCQMELPAFGKLSRELDGKVQFVGVNSMETGDKDLMPRRHKLTWPLARDIGPKGSAYHDKLAPGYGMPVTAFYDANGKLLHVQKGGLLEDDLRLTLKQVYGIR
ncbi:MAG: cytochrome c biosis protein CcmG, thiol:disulfide interchange protein DsbE [Cryptosporangiaceae bacterium]|jgi:thiol-disulfide isomerase/thioredoxin|nr:cytochrome c biosis protein CcmG, thiol:disulfide interchange protein DsbE [Cryptosporangiaceae bacterium]